jgi:hydroxylamine reductase (hybrid-cluster protein)
MLSESKGDINNFEKAVSKLNNKKLKIYIDGIKPSGITNFNLFKEKIANNITENYHNKTFKFTNLKFEGSKLFKEKFL